MRLYHSGSRAANGARFGAGDEEDCYSPSGRRRGIWLTSEPQAGPGSRSVDLASDVVGPYEMTGDGDAHRTFMVPLELIGHVATTSLDPPARARPVRRCGDGG
ncbi:MAG: hypothetical protein ACRD0G_06705 [Acidimicrobiales bacterium]